MSQQLQATVQTQKKATELSSIKGSMLRHAAVSSPLTSVHGGTLQRCSGGVECAACREKREGMQRVAVNSAPVNAIPPIVHDVLSSSGQPLDAQTREFMEPRFGHDFSQVRVHTDARAAESARAVNALAYTVGRDVVFGMSQYAPGTMKGKRLLAHELTHVVHQGGVTLGTVNEISSPTSGSEQEATSMAERVVQNMSYQSQVSGHVSSNNQSIIQRKPDAGAMPDAGVSSVSSSPNIAQVQQPGPISTGTTPTPAPKVYTFSVSYSKCKDSPYDEATVKAAAKAAFDKVSTSDCLKSESLKDEVLSKFNGLEIDCDKDGDDCGQSRRYFTHTIHIMPPSLNPAGKCGPLESTILHEVIHQTEWRPIGHGVLADACEKSCFGYGSGDASKCK